MNQRAFIKAVRNWDADMVASALHNQPELAKFVDKIGKTDLPYLACAESGKEKVSERAQRQLTEGC